eukprot:8904909-Lingulodinium_polyedra.AAC.1
MLEYMRVGRETFSPDKVAVLSVALDGTRMDQRDTLYCALYAPSLRLAMWAPPVVRQPPARFCEKRNFRKRKTCSFGPRD